MNAIDYYRKYFKLKEYSTLISSEPLVNLYTYELIDSFKKLEIITLYKENNIYVYRQGMYTDINAYVVIIPYDEYTFMLYNTYIEDDLHMYIFENREPILCNDLSQEKIDKFLYKLNEDTSELAKRINLSLDFLTYNLKILK